MNHATNSLAQRLQCLSLLALAGILACQGNEPAVPAPAAAETIAQALESAKGDYYIVTRLDSRTCASPTCGGYFVKLANLATTRCADFSQGAECHALRLDFSPSGLTAAEGARFEQEFFASKFGLVKAALVKRALDPLRSEDVLVVSEAWQGQAHSVPTGFFNLITPTGTWCTSLPCDAYDGTRLNTGVEHSFDAVKLAAAGAPSDGITRANQAMDGAGLIVAGGDTGRELSASEFYVRAAPCIAAEAVGAGVCGGRILSYKWDGQSCVAITGCICLGRDCSVLPTTLAACQRDHVACGGQGCGPGRPACGAQQYCDFPGVSVACGTTGQAGQCRPRPGICAAVNKPVCGCDGRAYASACEANLAGTDAAYEGTCK